MTITSEISRINDNISAAYTAASNKGATLPATQNSDNLATCIASIPSGGSSGKYSLLQRVTDDSNNEIGTVSGFFKDENDTEYAVVCLDAQYREREYTWASNSGAVTNLPLYNSSVNGCEVDLISNKYTDTATSNCDKILAWCTTNSYSSQTVSHCRGKSFVIEGTTYYGQLPNICELFDIMANRVEINNADTSTSSYPLRVIDPIPGFIWSSTQSTSSDAWTAGSFQLSQMNKYQRYLTLPILEIPNAL